MYIYAVRLGAAKIDLVIQYWDLYSFDEILCRKKIKWYHLMLYIYDLYVNVFCFQWICTLLLQFHFKVGYQYWLKKNLLLQLWSSLLWKKEDVAVPDYQLPCQRIVQAVFGFIHMLNSVFMKELKELPHYSSFTKCYETVPYDWTGLHCVLYFWQVRVSVKINIPK